MSAVAEPEAGALFAERYRIERRLGEGGMGTVYAAHDTRLDETVALKTLSIGSIDGERIERFHREVRLARRITHANVARTHDIGEAAGLHFLTMELIVGCSLDELLEKQLPTKPTTGPFPAAEAASVCRQIATGLQAAHDAEVVHRDLKPANVMVEGEDTSGRVVITDFGVARALDRGGKGTSGSLGTPIYMAPEQIMGEPTGFATDIYSLGVILYEMLTGTLPFVGDTPMAIALARCRLAPTDPREHVEVNGGLVEIVMRCLELDPQSRPRSAGDVANRLSHIGHAATARTVMVTPSRPPEAPPHPSYPHTPGSISSPFAPMSPGRRTLAVLPFAFRGPSDIDYLGESLAEEIIDTLSRTRGLRVLGFGATSQYDKATDPRVAGEALGADAIVTASVQGSPSRIRVSARLSDVSSGVQIWSERFDTKFEDAFEMQERMAKRIAEALRAELHLIEHRWHATAEVTELYLRARKLIRSQNYMGGSEAVDLLDRCVELSPRFSPALAARAIAAMNAWWMDIIANPDTKWDVRSKVYVDEALAHADDLAETHLASAMYALQIGDLPRTATELANALAIAPTLPEAHRYLADLQTEAGRLDEGYRRARLALELDPSLSSARFCIARFHALKGHYDACREELDGLGDRHGQHHTAVLVMQIRFAAWFGKMDELEDAVNHVLRSDDPIQQMMAGFCRYLLGELDGSVIDGALAFANSYGNRRLTMLMGQIATEAHAATGHREQALSTLAAIAGEALADVAWLDLCPVLASIRDTPEFEDARSRVRNRSARIWELNRT